jgi:hypothetical protein
MIILRLGWCKRVSATINAGRRNACSMLEGGRASLARQEGPLKCDRCGEPWPAIGVGTPPSNGPERFCGLQPHVSMVRQPRVRGSAICPLSSGRFFGYRDSVHRFPSVLRHLIGSSVVEIRDSIFHTRNVLAGKFRTGGCAQPPVDRGG